MAVHKLAGKATASSRSNNQVKSEDYNKIKLLGKDTILFVFKDELESDEFTNDFGLILSRELSVDKPRWGFVVKSNNSELKFGDYILPEDVTESFGCSINEIEHWRTTSDKVLLVTNDLSVVENLRDA